MREPRDWKSSSNIYQDVVDLIPFGNAKLPGRISVLLFSLILSPPSFNLRAQLQCCSRKRESSYQMSDMVVVYLHDSFIFAEFFTYLYEFLEMESPTTFRRAAVSFSKQERNKQGFSWHVLKSNMCWKSPHWCHLQSNLSVIVWNNTQNKQQRHIHPMGVWNSMNL